MISGESKNTRQLLEAFAETGDYVFHGTQRNRLQREWKKLYPRQATSFGGPDGTPAVAASDQLDPAIFMAFFSKSYGAGMNLRPTEEFPLGLTVSRSAMEKAKWEKRPGENVMQPTVYVLARNAFTLYNGFEWRSPAAVAARVRFDVSLDDLLASVRVIDDPDVEEFVREARSSKPSQ